MAVKLRNPLIGPNKPTWNLYDIKDNPEYHLAESLATEFTDIAGIECTYYMRDSSVVPDQLYGEYPTKGYFEGKKTKILYEVGEIPTLYSMFGMVASDNIVVHIPQAVWYRDVSKTDQPSPEDVIVVHFYQEDYNGLIEGRTFEITHAAFDQSIFQLKSLVHVLYMKPYRYSMESQSASAVSSDLTSPEISGYGDNVYIDEHKYVDPDIDTTIYGA